MLMVKFAFWFLVVIELLGRKTILNFPMKKRTWRILSRCVDDMVAYFILFYYTFYVLFLRSTLFHCSLTVVWINFLSFAWHCICSSISRMEVLFKRLFQSVHKLHKRIKDHVDSTKTFLSQKIALFNAAKVTSFSVQVIFVLWRLRHPISSWSFLHKKISVVTFWIPLFVTTTWWRNKYAISLQ